MSAWARLVAKANPEELEELNAALVEIQTETARRLAEKLRKQTHDGELGDMSSADAVAHYLANLIDPEVQT